MNFTLKDKTVLITGASSGIGAATAKEFAKEGATVLLVARNLQNLNKIADSINNGGGKSKVFAADVSDYKVVKKLAETVKSEVGIPDIIVNNAGSGTWKFMDETSYEEVSQIMALPYFGTFYVTKAFLPEIQERGTGHIVNMTSIAGFISFPGATAYIASRTAMVGFSNALAADLNKTKVKTSLAYFAKVESDYWKNNPGSEERLPSSQSMIPVISSERAAKILVKGIKRGKRKITGPFMMFVMNFLIQYFPRITQFILNLTGYKRN